MNIVQIYKKFPTEEDCINHIENVRWRGCPVCPYCASTRTSPNQHRHHCNNCNTSFSATVGTIFHHTHLPLQKWFLAISLVLNAKKGFSARQLARDMEVNKNTAWYVGMRIRNAMFEHGELLKGIEEMDETYIGGKPRKGTGPHKHGRGTSEAPVVGMIERGGRVVAKPVDKSKLDGKSLAKFIRKNVEFADAVLSFWGLLKRGIIGQYHKVAPRHLHPYIAEFCRRFNHRKNPALLDRTIARALGANA